MAVPGRRNGLNDDDDDYMDDENALFEEEGLVELEESNTPPHLRDLAAAAEHGDLDALRRALGGFIEIVQLLLSRANDTEHVKRMLNTVDSEGDTPLHHAARGEHVDVIRLLLAYGASPTKRNLYGKTPAELPDQDTDARRLLEVEAAAVATPC